MKNGIELRKSSEKGEGLFATQLFKAGETAIVAPIDRIVGGNHSHASQIAEDRFAIFSGLANKVNHSCNPNCRVRVSETGVHYFFARQEICVNEEITVDYAMWNYAIDHFPGKCECGANTCRGTITGWKDLSQDKKKAYEGSAAPYLSALDVKFCESDSGTLT